MTMTEPTTPAPANGVMLSRQAQPPAPIQQAPQLGPMQIDLRVAAELAKSDIVPKAFQGKASNILVAIGLGRSLGLEPAPSLYGMHVIEGTPSPTAKLQAALVRRAGHKLRILEHGPEQAVVQIVRADDPEFPVTVTFSIDDARAAGYLGVNVENWMGEPGKKKKQTHPLGEDFPVPCTEDDLKKAGAPAWAKPWMVKRRENWFSNRATMLHHRAVTRAVGMACPEVVSGLDFEIDETIVAETPDPIATLTPTPAPAAPAEAPAPSIDVVDAEIVPDNGASTSEGVVVGDQPGTPAGTAAEATTPSDNSDEPEHGEDMAGSESVPGPSLGDDFTGEELVAVLTASNIRQIDARKKALALAAEMKIADAELPTTMAKIATADPLLRAKFADWVNAGGQD